MSETTDAGGVAAAMTHAADAAEELTTAAAAFQALGMTRRLQVMQLFVHVSGTLCGCEIADVLELEDYQVSRDLAALRKAGLVEARERVGTWIHYRCATDPGPTLTELLALIGEIPLAPTTTARLERRLSFREQGGGVRGVGDPEVLAALDQAGHAQLPVWGQQR
ncbi:MAG: metalloregulator ArsR/SmtB family transcription factor [Nitriliruptoraceae bacterium]